MRAAVTKSLAAIALAGILATPGLVAQEPPTGAGVGGPGLENEVRALNATLGQLVELLRRQLESSNAAVLMQRVQLMTSRMAPLDEELQTARTEERQVQRELDEMELSASGFEAQLEQQVEAGNLTAEEARAQLEQQQPWLEQRRKQLEDRLWTLRQRVIGLEQRLEARRREIETWEGEIDRALGLR